MKTTSLHLIRRLFVSAVLGILASAVNAQAAPGAARHPMQVRQGMDLATDGHRHARKHETPVRGLVHEEIGWDRVTTLPDIPGALDLVVGDINNHGQIIGIYFDADFNAFGFVYAHGVYTSLDFFPSRINDRGQIVGSTLDSNFGFRNFVYDKGIYTSIEGGFPGAQEGSTLLGGINDRGQIVGFYSEGRNDHGFIYDKGVYTALPDVPGARFTLPQSINNRGQIVVWSYDSNIRVHSFVYDRGVYTAFDAPGAVNGTLLNDINNKGQIVGGSYDSNFDVHSFVHEKGVYTGIEIPGAQVTAAYGINDRGQIVGTYYDSDFQPHGFVLSR